MTRTVKGVLTEAKKILLTRGWHQGSCFGQSKEEGGKPSVCFGVALGAAAGLGDYYVSSPVLDGVAFGAWHLLRSVNNLPYPEDCGPACWNDDAKSLSEILTAIDKTLETLP